MAELAASGRRTRKDSVESLVRNFIQKQKIDMANEVIDAGRFDMQTSMDERRATLEALLQVMGGGRRGREGRGGREGKSGFRVRLPQLVEASC